MALTLASLTVIVLTCLILAKGAERARAGKRASRRENLVKTRARLATANEVRRVSEKVAAGEPLNLSELFLYGDFLVSSGVIKEQDRDFGVPFMVGYGSKIDKFIVSDVAGVPFTNADGTYRQRLIQSCQRFDQLKLRVERENPADRHAVKVLNGDEECLGYLRHEVAVVVSQDYEQSARIWFAIVRGFTENVGHPSGVVIWVCRVSEKFAESLMPASSSASVAALAKTGFAAAMMELPKP